MAARQLGLMLNFTTKLCKESCLRCLPTKLGLPFHLLVLWKTSEYSKILLLTVSIVQTHLSAALAHALSSFSAPFHHTHFYVTLPSPVSN